MKEEFIRIYEENIHRAGAENLLEWLKSSDFFTAPASTRYHSCHEGGLCEHSVNVFRLLGEEYRQFQSIQPDFQISEETLAVCGLLHDVCKVGFYRKERKSRKTGKLLPNGKPEWEDYFGYSVEDQLPYGHGEKSVYMITSAFMRLTREEAMAIRWHMGFSDAAAIGGDRACGNAFRQYPLALLLHSADLKATYLLEKEE